MKISELRTGQGNVEAEGVVTELGNTRVFNKYGRELKVADAIFTDDSGSIKLTLWNDDVTRFKEGDKIKVINGYVSEFQGEKQLTAGKFGRMEKISSSNQDKEEINDKVNDKENKDEISSSLEKGQSKTAVVSKKDFGETTPQSIVSPSSPNPKPKSRQGFGDLKKKNEESLDEYSEDTGEEPSEEEPAEEELF